jgi:transcriptional regulator with XRE-family HTH domain
MTDRSRAVLGDGSRTKSPTRFGSMLRLYRTVRQQSLRDIAAETGISHATLMRIEHGEAFDVATGVKLAQWLLAAERTTP